MTLLSSTVANLSLLTSIQVVIIPSHNNNYEIFFYDIDLDGNPDKAEYDENEDGTIDIVAYDYNQDGEWDKFKNIS